jgi:hypothetical protein
MSITDAAYRKAQRHARCHSLLHSCHAVSRQRHAPSCGAPRKLESAEDLLDKHPLAQAPDLDARLDALAQKQARALSLSQGA